MKADGSRRTIEVDVRRFDAKSDLAVLTVRSPFAHPSVLLDSRDALARTSCTPSPIPSEARSVFRRSSPATVRRATTLIAFSQATHPARDERSAAVQLPDRRRVRRHQPQPVTSARPRRLRDPDQAPVRGRSKLRGANGGAHDRGSHWVRALSIDQRQGWQASRTLEVEAEARSFTVSLGQSDEGWSVTADDSDAGPTARVGRPGRSPRGGCAAVSRLGLARPGGGERPAPAARRVLSRAACPGSIGERLRELSRSEGEPVIVNLCFESA